MKKGPGLFHEPLPWPAVPPRPHVGPWKEDSSCGEFPEQVRGSQYANYIWIRGLEPLPGWGGDPSSCRGGGRIAGVGQGLSLVVPTCIHSRRPGMGPEVRQL